MRRSLKDISWTNLTTTLLVAAVNLLFLAACERPKASLSNAEFDHYIPDSALFDVDPTNLRSSVDLTNQGPRNIRGTHNGDFTCQALVPECMHRRPHAMFVYLSNIIHSYYPQWNNFAWIRFGYGQKVHEPDAPHCTRGTWNIKIGGSKQVAPIRYYNNGNPTRINDVSNFTVDFDTETTGLAGLMLAFKGASQDQCYYTQPANPNSSWWWQAPVCNNIVAPFVTVSGTFEPNKSLNGNSTSLTCEPPSDFHITLQFENNRLTHFSDIQSAQNEIFGWTIEYRNQIYYPWFWGN